MASASATSTKRLGLLKLDLGGKPRRHEPDKVAPPSRQLTPGLPSKSTQLVPPAKATR
jgi:hypothetical protein